MRTFWYLISATAVILLHPVATQTPQQPGATAASLITHSDIRDAILTLVGAVREQTGKLERHELRERQLGDALTRSLRDLDSRTRGQDKNLENLAILMARTDERLRKMEEMVIQRDERERIQLQKITDNTVAIRNGIESGRSAGAPSGPAPAAASTGDLGEVLKQLTRTRKKVESVEESLQNRLSVVANEVKIVGEKYETRSERLESLQLTTMENLGKAQAGDAEKLRAASVNLVATEGKWRQFFSDAQNLVNQFGVGVNRISDHASRMKNDTSAILVGIEKLETSLENSGSSSGSQSNPEALVSAIQVHLKPTLDAVHSLVNDSYQSQMKLDENFKEGWQSLSRGIDKGVMNVTDVFQTRLGAFEHKMSESQKLIQDQVEESGNMAETLADRVDKSYASLAKEIHGLQKVEQVLLDTADGVLDTKRRLEFAVQQILLELGDSIRRQTGDLNSTLARKVDDVTFSVIKDQSTALTNMTSKLENELGQVWRQIGVLYQSASQSQELLQRVEQQTAQHVGGSLQALSSMDKRVGQVTERVNEVDDHLNFLLGRLSLVVQEFNQVRGGLGEALESLRSGLAVTGQQPSTTAGKSSSPPYDVSSGPVPNQEDVTVITRKENINNDSDEN
ncbi:putative leucine-rich repeat-containing protein DDB_G0290503 [Daphnia pulex]|uniref:Paramyosin n=1 Tax=Daphnia pulex TaxID=6669 RepID=E9H3D3_DAPPU|nr:putative leucine-rich repeat-containing protein DDB_G0290503 [Daphnia pulex]EFX73743.1 hypothetical protein DAPPUDRAFT_307604 [Daphnia pulex]|eukprot:EFX73743.1 hypothetical protein DAPPUDRAFT_307604 [Daphnia pulex]